MANVSILFRCTQYPLGFTLPLYKSSLDDIYLIDASVALIVFSIIDGLLKIIPALMFPVITFLLIKELRTAESIRRKTSQGSFKKDSAASEQTTKLVILMAITFIAAELPIGAIYVAQGVLINQPVIVEITYELVDVLGIFVAINATTHCLICLGVSSQYRRTVKALFKFCIKTTKPLATVRIVS